MSLLHHTREGDDDLNQSALKSCRVAALQMEELLFSVGGAERTVSTLRCFKERPAVRELNTVRNNLATSTNAYSTKEERLNAAIVKGVKDFLGMIKHTRNEGNKGGGRIVLEDQNAYDAVMAAIYSKDMTGAGLGRLLSMTFNVTFRQMKRGRTLRGSMEDMDKARWIRKSSTVPKDAIGEGENFVLISNQYDRLF